MRVRRDASQAWLVFEYPMWECVGSMYIIESLHLINRDIKLMIKARDDQKVDRTRGFGEARRTG